MLGAPPWCGTTQFTALDSNSSAPHGPVEWTLARTNPGAATTLAALDAQNPAWHPAVVPGTVAAAFPSADPLAWTGVHDLDAADWWYRCSFATPDPENTSAEHELVFHGLATIADVWLNGEAIVHGENMFTAHRSLVTSLLRRDGTQNELVVRFTSLHTALAARRPRPRWRTKLVERQQMRWMRTTMLGRIVGWADSPQPVGPWRPIVLETHRSVRVGDAIIRTGVVGRDGTLAVDIPLVALGAQTIASATLHVGDAEAKLSIAQNAGGTANDPAGTAYTLTGTARVADVELWWPHTHGAQPRYAAHIILAFGDGSRASVDLGRVAFRTVELDTTNGQFTIRINGETIFCRGACWSPIDTVTLSGSADAYRTALVQARAGGMNMLRVGGTMVYEHDAFYETCDELGILVWQEFMFSNMDYPDDPAFTDSVRTEARQLLRRLQTRASVVLYCGNNEVQQQASMLAMPRELWNGPIFSEVLPEAVTEHAPGIPYWASSPSGGTLPFHVNAGDAHYFGHGPYLRSFDDVRLSNVQFASETLAFASIPEPSTVDLIPGGSNGAGHHPGWKRGVPRDPGASWDFEDVREHYVEQLFKVDLPRLRRHDVERYLALGRVASGEVIGRTIAAWRRADSTCRGALIWMMHDLRIGAGWGLVDSRGLPKAAYYYFRRSALPIIVVLSDEGLNGVRLDVSNDRPTPLDATLRLALYRHGEVPIADVTTSITVAPRSTETLHGDALLDQFVDPTYAYMFGPPGHDLVVATLHDAETNEHLSDAFLFPLGLPSVNDRDPGIEAEATLRSDGAYDLHLTTRAFAQSVAIDTEGFRPDDNYMHIAPGQTRTTTLRPRGDAQQLDGTVTPLNAVKSYRITIR